MALKHKITKAEYDKIATDAIKIEYKADGESFVLDVDGLEDVGALTRAKDREVQTNKDLRKELKEANEKAVSLQTDLDAARDPKTAKDIKTLETSWQGKLDAEKSANRLEVEKRDRAIKEIMVSKVANEVAVELSGDNAAILLPHIERRLAVEFDGETPITRILDKEGKKSALSIDDLKKEIAGDSRYKSVVVASKASGGGANGGNRNNSGADRSGKKFNDLNEKERIALHRENPVEFARLSEEAKQQRLGYLS